MKRNKIIALLLSMILALNLGIPAMAADTFTKISGEGEAADTPITNTGNITEAHVSHPGIKVPTLIQVPVIKITLSKPGNIIVNPFGIKFQDSGAADRIATDEIISVPSTITNKSSVAVKLNITPTVNVANANADAEDDDIVKVDETGSPLTGDGKAIQVTMATLRGTATAVADPTSYNSDTVDRLVKKAGTTPIEMTLENVNGTSKPCGGYMFKGETSGAKWTTSDKVTIKLLFEIAAMGNDLDLT